MDQRLSKEHLAAIANEFGEMTKNHETLITPALIGNYENSIERMHKLTFQLSILFLGAWITLISTKSFDLANHTTLRRTIIAVCCTVHVAVILLLIQVSWKIMRTTRTSAQQGLRVYSSITIWSQLTKIDLSQVKSKTEEEEFTKKAWGSFSEAYQTFLIRKKRLQKTVVKTDNKILKQSKLLLKLFLLSIALSTSGLIFLLIK